jgi:anti-sigma factor RsiW
VTQYEQKLSAYLDGELPADEAREIEAALAGDPVLQSELETLMAADNAVSAEFEAMLDEPVPLELAKVIFGAPEHSAVNLPNPPRAFGWMTAVAVVVALIVGGSVGYLGGSSKNVEVAKTPVWLADIADYHRVYAGQKRHLVEVGSDEADHIEGWLSKTIGTGVHIPDLSEQGLTFAGGRLLVAAGKPVAQLMYLDTESRVVALCLIQSNTPREGIAELNISAFDLVTWGAGNANFVVIGDEDRDDLTDIALLVAEQA